MGGKSKAQTIGYHYKWAMHFAWTRFADALLEIRGGGVTAWQGRVTENTVLNINKPDLWGGEKGQGGIVGDLEVLFGGPTQTPSSYLSATFGDKQSGNRGLVSSIFKGGRYGAFLANPKPMSMKFERIHAGSAGWYPEKAPIGMIATRPLALYFALDCSTSMHEISSNGQTRLANMATAVNNTLQFIADMVTAAGGVAVDIMIVGWGGTSQENLMGREAITRRGVDAADIADLQAWVSALGDTDYATYFPAAVADVATFYASAPANANRIVLFVTDGQPGDWDNTLTPEETLQLAKDTGETLFATSGIQAHAINIDLDDTTYTEYVDNTSTDGIPVLSGGDSDAMTSIIIGALGGLWARNPAHMIHEALTHVEMAGEPTGLIDDASFTAAADKFYSEGFGLCTTYDSSQETPWDYIRRICGVVGAECTQSRLDGKYYLDPVRGGYDIESLPIITEDDILEFKASPAGAGAVNSISVKWHDPAKHQDRTTPPVVALGRIQSEGEIIPAVKSYTEIPVESLALRVAKRELDVAKPTLQRYDLAVRRKHRGLRPGQPFRLQVPSEGIADAVLRLGSVRHGTHRDGRVRLSAVQDVFSLPATAPVQPSPGEWQAPASTPTAPPAQTTFEAPYVELSASMSAADLNALADDAGYLLTAAALPSAGFNYVIATAAASEEFVERATADFCPTAEIVEAAALEDPLPTVFTLAAASMLDRVTVGSWALWGEEIVRVDAIDATAGSCTLGRGCADTVPAAHAASERIWFCGDWVGSDGREYVDADVVNAKLLPRTSSGQYPIGSADASVATMDQRQARPYPPGDVRFSDAVGANQVWPAELSGDITVSWAHRDRLLQADQLVDTSAASVGPEPGVTYTVRYEQPPGTEVESESAIAGVAATPYAFPVVGAARIKVEAVRDGLRSWQQHVLDFMNLTDAGGDAHWLSVSSLLNFGGADGSTSFTDEKSKVWTASGNAQIDTSLGYNTGLFDGNDLISTPSHADFDFGSGLWTIELWLYPLSVSGFQNLLRKSVGTNFAPFSIALDGNKLRTRCSENGLNWAIDRTSVIALATGSLVHVAACRDASNTFRQYVGGVESGTSTFGGALMGNSSAVYLGAQSDAASGYNGHIQGLRITKGVCRYPGGTSFTPPPAPFPAF